MRAGALTTRHRPSRVATAKTGKTYLVTGGHGLLGSHLVEALLARGEERVRIFDIAASPLFGEEASRGWVRFHQGDLRVRAALDEACRGADTVFHTAASVNFWADQPFEFPAVHAVNMAGTEALVAACEAAGVRQLMSTSSTSVVVPHDIATRPLVLADESVPLASAPFLCHYISTKGMAERAVLAADGRGLMNTAALRPGGLYGPRDKLLIAAAARGTPGICLPDSVVDHIYVENVVHAFLLLESRLAPGSPVCGKAYFITNYPPSVGSEPAFEFGSRLAECFGHKYRLLPRALPSALAFAAQAAVRATRGRASRHLGALAMLRPASLTLARATYYFSHHRAEADFGYAPLFTADEGRAASARHFKGE